MHQLRGGGNDNEIDKDFWLQKRIMWSTTDYPFLKLRSSSSILALWRSSLSFLIVFLRSAFSFSRVCIAFCFRSKWGAFFFRNSNASAIDTPCLQNKCKQAYQSRKEDNLPKRLRFRWRACVLALLSLRWRRAKVVNVINENVKLRGLARDQSWGGPGQMVVHGKDVRKGSLGGQVHLYMGCRDIKTDDNIWMSLETVHEGKKLGNNTAFNFAISLQIILSLHDLQ